jgi:hypothetical protein
MWFFFRKPRKNTNGNCKLLLKDPKVRSSIPLAGEHWKDMAALRVNNILFNIDLSVGCVLNCELNKSTYESRIKCESYMHHS